jgi:hypothetical protein
MPTSDGRSPRPPGDGVRLFLVGCSLLLVFILVIAVMAIIR